jgi:cell division protein ZapA (FtsZ GTPase activity inhibitor)
MAASMKPASIDITIGGQQFQMSTDEPEEHLKEVADLVQRRLETLRRKMPTLSLQNAAMLAAFDFASQVLKSSRKADERRQAVAERAQSLLERVENELAALRNG